MAVQESTQSHVQEAAMKCLLEYASRTSPSSPSSDIPQSGSSLEWWTLTLSFVTGHLSDPTDGVRALALDTLSHIPYEAFDTLPDRHRMSILSVVLGLLQDPEPNVRAAACGVLGVFVSFDCLKEVVFLVVQSDIKESLFISDLSSQLPSLVLDDDSLIVRMRASWALANLCQFLMERRQEGREGFENDTIHILVQAGLHAVLDNDKVNHTRRDSSPSADLMVSEL